MVYKQITDLIGSTPLLHLKKIEKLHNIDAKIIAKLECFNPAGSVKDRVAIAMVEQAEKDGKLKEGSVIIEPTSGNTGIGLAMCAALKGYKIILTMPDTMSQERIQLLKAYNAEIMLTDGKLGMKGAIEKAISLNQEIKNSFIPSQFENPNNPLAHYLTTGPEIFNDLDGEIDIFTAGIGTGGTITGVGRYLKEKNEKIKIIGIEPDDSPVLTKGISGPHALQGIGAGFVPDVLDVKILDEVITVTKQQAFEAARDIAKYEGLLIGISSGAAVAGAILLAKRDENKKKTIVALLPDTGERYLSTNLFEN